MFWGESSIWFEDLGFSLLSQLFLGLRGSCLGFYVGVYVSFWGWGLVGSSSCICGKAHGESCNA